MKLSKPNIKIADKRITLNAIEYLLLKYLEVLKLDILFI